jgi:hypothetical protein
VSAPRELDAVIGGACGVYILSDLQIGNGTLRMKYGGLMRRSRLDSTGGLMRRSRLDSTGGLAAAVEDPSG